MAISHNLTFLPLHAFSPINTGVRSYCFYSNLNRLTTPRYRHIHLTRQQQMPRQFQLGNRCAVDFVRAVGQA